MAPNEKPKEDKQEAKKKTYTQAEVDALIVEALADDKKQNGVTTVADAKAYRAEREKEEAAE